VKENYSEIETEKDWLTGRRYINILKKKEVTTEELDSVFLPKEE